MHQSNDAHNDVSLDFALRFFLECLPASPYKANGLLLVNGYSGYQSIRLVYIILILLSHKSRSSCL